MKTLVSVILVSSIFGGLLGCGTVSRIEGTGDSSTFAQATNQGKQKQGAKLYPYYLDYAIDLSLDGEQLSPVLFALDEFKKDQKIPQQKKNLSKYKIELRQDNDLFFVRLWVKPDPGKSYLGGETEDGVAVTYFISKKDGSITRVFDK